VCKDERRGNGISRNAPNTRCNVPACSRETARKRVTSAARRISYSTVDFLAMKLRAFPRGYCMFPSFILFRETRKARRGYRRYLRSSSRRPTNFCSGNRLLSPVFPLILLLSLDVYFNFTSPGIFIHEIHFSSNTFFSVSLPRVNIGSDWVYVRSVHLKTNSRSLSDSNARVSSEEDFLRGFVLNERYCSRIMLHAYLKSLCLFFLNWTGSRWNDSFADYSRYTLRPCCYIADNMRSAAWSNRVIGVRQFGHVFPNYLLLCSLSR